MEIQNECLPCVFRQAYEACTMMNEDPEKIREVLQEVARFISEIPPHELSPLVTERIQKLIKDKTGIADPYRDFKEDNIRQSLKIYSEVKKSIENHKHPLTGALIMAATGNAIDAGITLQIEVDEIVDRALETGFAASDQDKFFELLEPGTHILIVGDNTGEAVFDKLLIEELNNYEVDVTYVVREQPVLNDITMEEALEIGLDEVSTVISSGCKAPGLILEEASSEFMEYYNQADIIISKGQGNLEALTEYDREIFYLLKAKCDIIADLLGVNVNDTVFLLK